MKNYKVFAILKQILTFMNSPKNIHFNTKVDLVLPVYI
nr:MAG TPA: hypothetical protein [Caudoviricetes sp.]